jgi:NifB/MoaA-like Fe-S oxidoreductase
MEVLRRLVSAGIVLHGQIVVCPGINDGEELRRSLARLSELRPGLATVAVVPVGLTSHRNGLPPLRPVTPEEARETLALLAELAGNRTEGGKEPFAVAADEYYLLAGKRFPGRSAYGTFPQIGNGVGLVRRFLDESRALLRRRSLAGAGAGGTVVSGLSPRGLISDFLGEFGRRAGAAFRHLPVENRLMGKSVTVTGLLSGSDIVSALAGTRGASRIYIPSVCLRSTCSNRPPRVFTKPSATSLYPYFN